jgi:hypothetical protein
MTTKLILLILASFLSLNVLADEGVEGDQHHHGSKDEYHHQNDADNQSHHRTNPNVAANVNASAKSSINTQAVQRGTDRTVYTQYSYPRYVQPTNYYYTSPQTTQTYYQYSMPRYSQPVSYYYNYPQTAQTYYQPTVDAYANYDPYTGVEFTEIYLSTGDTDVKYHNRFTDAYWETVFKQNGDQYGVDEQGNSWQYNKAAAYYLNFGTREVCVGAGASQTCVFPTSSIY